MFELASIIPLLIQAAFTIVGVDQLRRNVFANANKVDGPRLISDVWAPLVIVGPMMFFVGSGVEHSVSGASWMTLGGPVICGVVAMGMAMLVMRNDNAGDSPITSTQIAVWTGAGVFFLLLGAAHELTLWAGQCAFAVVAVLLWINTPEIDRSTQPANQTLSARTGIGMVIAVVCAIGQGVASRYVPANAVQFSAIIMLLGAIVAIAGAARLAGADFTLRLGGWAMAYGILLGVGLISVRRLIVESIRMANDQEVEQVNRVAYGFGSYAIEAMIASLFATVIIAIMPLPPTVRRAIGGCCIVLAIVVSVWRISRF